MRTPTLRSLALALALVPAACVGQQIDTRFPQTYEPTELLAASMKLSCPKRAITLAPFAGPTRIARGCGREAMVTCLGPGEFAGEFGQCFPMQDLKKRAAFELGCQSSVTLTPLDTAGRTVGVSACGRTAVYDYVQVGDDYDWTLSSQRAREPARE